MGGKKQPRTKGNVQPSSSSRAAEMLNLESSGGFVGFGGLKEAAGNTLGYVPRAGSGLGTSEEAELKADAELRMVMRRMTKKDTTTRLKAIQDFQELCMVKTTEDIEGILPFWPKIYNKIALDVDHRAREAIQSAHGQVAAKAGRKMAPYLKLVIGNWLLAQFDPSAPCSSAARKAFETAFAKAKQMEAILFCQKEIFETFKSNLFQSTADTLSDPKVVPKEEREAKYHRLLSCTLLAFDHVIKACTEDAKVNLADDYQAVVSEKKFWKLSKQASPLVRAAFFELLSTMLEHEREIAASAKPSLCAVVFDSIGEANASVAKFSWNCILQTIKYFEDCWENVSVTKLVLPKLWSTLKSAGYGNCAIVYPCILPLLRRLPNEVVNNGLDFYRTFYAKFLEGLTNERTATAAEDRKVIVTAYVSCMRFALTSSPLNDDVQAPGEEEVTLSSLVHILVLDLIKTALLYTTVWAGECFLLVKSIIEETLQDTLASGEIAKRRGQMVLTRLKTSFQELLEIVVNTGDSKVFALTEEFVKVLSPRTLMASSWNISSGGHCVGAGALDGDRSSASTDFESYFSSISQTLQSSLCRLCYEKMSKEDPMPFLGLLVNVIAYHPTQCVVGELNDQLSRRTHNSPSSQARDSLSLCRSVAENLVTAFVTEPWTYVENEDMERSLSSFSVQRGLVVLLSRLTLILDSRNAKLTYCTGLMELKNTPDYLCSVVKEITNVLSEDALREWLTSSGGAANLIGLLRDTLEDASHPQHYLWDLLEALGRLLRAPSLGGHVMAKEDIDALSLVLKVELCKNRGETKEKNVTEALLKFSVDFVLRVQDKHANAAIEVFIGLAHFIVFCEDDSLSESCQSCVAQMARGFVDSGNQDEGFRRLSLWIGNTARNLKSQNRLNRLIAIIRGTTKGFDSEASSVESQHKNEAVSFLIKLLPSPVEMERYCFDRIRGLRSLLPLVACDRGLISVHGLIMVQEPEENEDKEGEFPLAFPILAVNILNLVWEFPSCLSKPHQARMLDAFVSSSSAHAWLSCSEALGYNVKPTKILRGLRWPCDDPLFPDSMAACEDLMASLLRLQDFPLSDLLRRVLTSAAGQGYLGVLHLDSLLAKVLVLNRCPLDDLLFEFLAATDIGNSSSVDAGVAVVAHVHDLSVIRAVLEQYADRFQEGSLSSVQETVGVLRMCLACMQSWHGQLKLLAESLSDYGEFVPNILDALISWKDTHSNLLLFKEMSKVKGSAALIDLNIVIARLLGFAALTVPLELRQSHWDFLLCACASWMQTFEDLPFSSLVEDGMVFLVVSVCGVIAVLNDIFDKRQGTDLSMLDLIYPVVITRCSWSTCQPDFSALEQVDDSLITEWEEFFSPPIHRSALKLFRSLISETETIPTKPVFHFNRLLLLASVSGALMKFPAVVLTNLVFGLTEDQDKAQGQQTAPQRVDASLINSLFGATACPVHNVAVSAYQLLSRLSLVIHNELCTSQELEEGPCRSFPTGLLSVIDTCSVHILDLLSEAGARIGNNLVLVEDESLHYMAGYLLSWLLVFRVIKLAPLSSRAAYASFLSKEDLLHSFMVIIFSVLPSSPGWNPGPKGHHVEFGYERIGMADIQRLAFLAYSTGLECTPALIRSVYNNALDRRSSGVIERFTSRLISPALSSQELSLIQASSTSFDNMTIKCRPAAREVAAIYSIEDVTMELVVKLADCHPLTQITVDCGKRVGVTSAQWRQWMLQLTMFLTQQNGSVLDGLTLWKKNVDKKFEGLEECMICFSIIHGSNYSLPTIGCKTCKKKFHAACLYKWFHTSNNSSCPLCRNTF